MLFGSSCKTGRHFMFNFTHALQWRFKQAFITIHVFRSEFLLANGLMAMPSSCSFTKGAELHNMSLYLTYSMQLSPFWGANSFSASQDVYRILWKSRVNYHAHMIPILSSPDPSILFKIHINIILLSTPRSSNWTLSCIFPNQKPVCISLLLHMITQIIFIGQYTFNGLM
jgi:hypothetical protein